MRTVKKGTHPRCCGRKMITEGENTYPDAEGKVRIGIQYVCGCCMRETYAISPDDKIVGKLE